MTITPDFYFFSETLGSLPQAITLREHFQKWLAGLFHGQENCRTEFTVTVYAADLQTGMAFAQNDLGIGNHLNLLDDELRANLHPIQLRHQFADSNRGDEGRCHQ